MPLLILSLIIQVGLVVHIIKTGRNTVWVFIVLFFPVVGALAYAIVELLPEFTRSRTAHRARRGLVKAVDPDRDLREARQRFEAADTAQNAIALAQLQVDRAMYGEAKALYERFLTGIYASDPALLEGLARAQFGLKDFDGTVATLDRLKQTNPDHRSGEAHLLYARALEGAGRRDAAVYEYEALVRYYAGPEAACRLALLLKAGGDAVRARELFEGVARNSRNAGAHYNDLHREWVELARREAPSA
jgi:hypothetical protein